ncbi:5-methyltetrahydropteroyltriglutamate--homocysteine S-methyltransferase [Quadrisphaera oryzae]|uniref:5-methyltetrahydropteroyltriglutamate-- homocysteine S-methyltransferase n=1 Tax=Quadrisphaera TaxID=317661 RepID=UPI001647BB3F|nr:5-methyltetrahydropteroyltriglutamate--homocysteine S-methyltransferase [Quadrisphaera sp. RL12-1S]MBC3762641.1 5-methyltetrahydropteroyltriglutamate--homocysteine S-methyltransferase [Quadrisphaera sp. RL12-1S]
MTSSTDTEVRHEVVPFHADHVGSLLRPPALRGARAQRAAGEITAEQLTEVEDAAVRDVVRRQADLGLRVVTDGELRRHYWHEDFILSLGGIEVKEAFTRQFHTLDGEPVDVPLTRVKATAPVHLEHTVFADHLAFLQRAAQEQGAGQVPKLTMPSPNQVHNTFIPLDGTPAYGEGGPGTEADERLRADIAAAYAEQLRRLHTQGLRYAQLDDVSLTFFGDPKGAGLAQSRLPAFIDLFNAAIADRPADLKVATHLCRGNYRSSWAQTGGYEQIAERLFNDLGVDGYFLEFDDERSGSLDVLRFLPPGKRVVLGLVTTKVPALEDEDALVRRIEEAATFAPLEQLALSGQCGFSSTEEGNDLTEDEQWRKLELVVRVAERVWG